MSTKKSITVLSIYAWLLEYERENIYVCFLCFPLRFVSFAQHLWLI